MMGWVRAGQNFPTVEHGLLKLTAKHGTPKWNVMYEARKGIDELRCLR
jgi:hypothetical protein